MLCPSKGRFPFAVISMVLIFLANPVRSAQIQAEMPRTSRAATNGSPPFAAVKLHAARSSPFDLELGGEIVGLPPGSTRFLTRDDLLTLPQVHYTVSDDSNFTRPTEISGVALEELARTLGAAPLADMVVAICDDQYRANYPRAYMAAHHPVLVLTIDGQQPANWPKDAEGHGLSMGPFLISHPKFTPGSKSFSHADEAQIPWGVVRLEFRREQTVFGAIAPRGPGARDAQVQAGYRIARQNCFRCHNMGKEGGTKAGHPWLVLSAWSTASPDYFAAYVHNPRAKNPHAQMPGFPDYDEDTLRALETYFQTFSFPSPSWSGSQEKP
jgi:mono/diheme cytochrome c family protein